MVAAIEPLGARALAARASVANPQDLDRLFTAAPDRFGHFDIVVANAGGVLRRYTTRWRWFG